jgi:hypothetical protein
MESIAQDASRWPFLHNLAEVMPFADLAFGGAMLLVIMLVHAAGVRGVTVHVVRRSEQLLSRPSGWLADVLMLSMVALLLLLHVVEIVIWSAALVESGIVADWRVAGFFAGNTYTTIGYGNFVLPMKWGMLAPLIAISGLFAFGWSCAVLVDLVARCQRIRDAAQARGKRKA